jgi:hypothetical protein
MLEIGCHCSVKVGRKENLLTEFVKKFLDQLGENNGITMGEDSLMLIS